MIVSELYATNSRVTHPDTGGTIVDEFTRRVYEIGEDNAGAYYLGWIKKDTLPSNCLSSTLTVDGEEGSRTYTWENITDDDNFPCGYISGDIQGANQHNTTISRRLQYINQLYPEYSCEMEDISTTWALYLYDSTGEHLIGSRGTTGITFPIKAFSRLCMGYTDASFTITFRDESSSPIVDRHFTLTPDNLGHLMDDSDEYLEWIDEDDSEESAHCKLRVALRGFYVPPGRRYYNRAQYEPFNAQWFVKTTCTFNNVQYEHYAYSQSPDTFYPNDGSPYTGGDYANYGYIFEFPYRDINRFANKIIQYGLHGEFTESQLQAVISSQNQYVVSNNIIGMKSSASQLLFFPLFKLKDVFKCLCLQYRTDIDITRYPDDYLQGYIPGRTYATDVTPEDEFLAKWKTGDINDPTFKDSLRPWQYENFQVNEFTEDDVPGPSPGPGPKPDPEPPGGDEHGGDDITLPSIDGLGGTFGFITQYALRGSQLQELGNKLWSGFNSSNPDIDDYLQNFVYRVDLDTGSVNMSDIMEFFVSLRAYPLPLGNLTTVTAAGNDFYIGSGAEPLKFTSTLHTADCLLAEIDAGSVSIPFWFGDYRDYQTEITLYVPYCGTAELNAADVMGGTLTATYVVDLSTGSCTAYVMCDTYDGKTYPVAILPGQLGVDIPITASNAGRVGARLLGDRINVAENLLGVAKNGITGIGAIMSGNFAGAMRSGVQAFIDPALNEQKMLSGMGERGAIAAPMLSGGRGLAAFKNPATAYVQVRSPFYAVPSNFPDAVGDPAAVSVRVGDCSGFCQFVNVDVSGIATDADDQRAIRAALESGVII